MSKQPNPVVLASSSPRRRELICHLGLPVVISPSDAPEDVAPGIKATQMVTTLAVRKASRVAGLFPQSVVLGADTTVEIDGQILNKPESPADADRMLRLLGGRAHHVHTGLAVVAPGGTVRTSVMTTEVRMRRLTDQELRAYLATGESFDKAGGYGIQGAAGEIVESVEGCYTNVVGLPLCAAARLLIAAGSTITAHAPNCSFRGNFACPCWLDRD